MMASANRRGRDSPLVPSDDSCPFCAIARGEDRSVEVICEDEDWIAFFPLHPATPAHTLVIPRAHFPDLWSIDAELGAQLAKAVIRVGQAIMNVLDPEGMNLISSSGSAAEQTIFHLHLHVVPRWQADDFGRIWPPEGRTHRALDASVTERIRAACITTVLDDLPDLSGQSPEQ
jgi:histidine triad (HIT) family protein